MTKTLLVVPAKDNTFKIGVRVAQLCGNEIDILLFNDKSFAEKISCIKGVSKIFYSDNPVFSKNVAEPCAAQIATFGKSYDVIIMAANTTGKNILPRVSGLLKRIMISDVMEIEGDIFTRPIYAGNALQKLKIQQPYLLSFRPSSFEPMNETQSACPIELIQTNIQTDVEWISLASHPKERPDLSTAKIVVAGGRGLKSKEQFQLIEHLADLLGAAVGASRAAVDAGFVPNDYQVGQTGKIVAPTLYIAIGISGAIQHLAGMKSSKVIVAINQDIEAPIFKIADYGWVTDLFQAIPALENALKEGN